MLIFQLNVELDDFIVSHHDQSPVISSYNELIYFTPHDVFQIMSYYTERQKKLITSLEFHSLKSKAST